MVAIANPLSPKQADGILRVISIGRISTVHQDEDSISASHDYVRRYLQFNGHV